MMETPARRAVSMVASSIGDDLERATAAFRGLSDERMDQQYGESGRTCRQILDEYKQRRLEDEAALAWVKSAAGI